MTVLNNESSLVDEIAGMCKQANMPDDLRVSAQLSVFDALMQSPSYGVSVPYYLTGVVGIVRGGALAACLYNA